MRSPFLSVFAFYQSTVAPICYQRHNLRMPKAAEAAVEYRALTIRDETGGASTRIFGIVLTGVLLAMLPLDALSMKQFIAN
jgi:hypothetical protein